MERSATEELDDFFAEVGGGGTPFPGARPPVRHHRPTKQVEMEVPTGWDDKPKRYRIGNADASDFFDMRALGLALGRTKETVRQWEFKGWLPAARVRTPQRKDNVPGRRLYSRTFIEKLQRIAAEEGVYVVGTDIETTKFPARAHALMEEVGA